ncbi:MAG: HTTM domain-containing protein [Deltaproteobacteria bacterium]|nr:HTTM domain-containing protein [Deltaproteobacteria bacterium]
MAKKKQRSSKPRPRPATPAVEPATPVDAAPKKSKRSARVAPVRAPAFWFGFEVAWAKLATARVVMFALLAIDALLQIRHAPRYGAGDFNVAHLPFLDGAAPGRTGYEVGQLLLAYLFVLAALGVATRVIVPVSAAIYAWLYFGSHLDSYQHHYLVALLLGIASFVPWARPARAEPSTPVRSWAVRLLLVQLGIMYLWAAISKMDPLWLDGRTLGAQLGGSLRSLVDSTVGLKVVAVLVLVVELVLAATVWLRPAWRVAAPLGILFHAGILVADLEIGLFAVLMLGLYVLVVPDRVWIALARTEKAAMQLVQRLAGRRGGVAWIAAVAAAIAVGILSRFEHGLAVALASCAILAAIAVAVWWRGTGMSSAAPLAHVCALLLWLVVDRASTVAYDYYRFWGSSQRRLGDHGQAERAYRKLIDLAPDDALGHYQLGRVLIATRRAADGIAELRTAQTLEPARARAFVEEARWLALDGKRTEAIERAKEAVRVEPSSAEARQLLQALTSNKRPPKPVASRDDDAESP